MTRELCAMFVAGCGRVTCINTNEVGTKRNNISANNEEGNADPDQPRECLCTDAFVFFPHRF